MSDYHVHLAPHRAIPEPVNFTADLVEQYVEVAAGRGITEIAITEHVYRCKEALPVLGNFWDDPTIPADIAAYTAGFVQAECNFRLDNYVSAVMAAKDRGLPVKMGLEVDFFPESIEGVMDLIDGYPFDVLVGSVHWVGGWAVDSQETQSEFDRRGLLTAYEQYADVLRQMADVGTLDVIGHADVPKRYGRALPAENGDIFQPVVRGSRPGRNGRRDQHQRAQETDCRGLSVRMVAESVSPRGSAGHAFVRCPPPLRGRVGNQSGRGTRQGGWLFDASSI